MKKISKLSILILMISMLFVSCQKEDSEFIDENPDAITASSPLAKLLMNTTQNNGGIDDFIDGTACSSIEFPYDVIINGQTITIYSESSLESLINANISSAITIVFPVTVVFEDFSTAVVNTQEELNALIDVCQTIEDAINCIDLIYPITFFTYDASFEQTGSVVLNSDAELFAYLSNLDEGVYISIDFPITVNVAGEGNVTVTSNSQLQDLIEGCTDVVDNLPTPEDLQSYLTSDSWFVSFFFDDEDETYLFAGYEFTFNLDGSASATNGSNTVAGSWAVNASSSGQLKLILNFGQNDPFDELDEDWKVIEFSNEIIRLFDVSGGDGSTDYLTFSRVPSIGGGDAQIVSDILVQGSWFVASYLDDGVDDETSNYNSFSFTFQANGTVSATNNVVTLNGSWFVAASGSGDLKLILNFLDVYPLDELDDDWLVIAYSNSQIQLKDDDDNDADVLIFEQE